MSYETQCAEPACTLAARGGLILTTSRAIYHSSALSRLEAVLPKRTYSLRAHVAFEIDFRLE